MNTVMKTRQQQELFHQNNKHRFTVKRQCSCCSKEIDETKVKFIGETSLGVWFNCTFCNSTMIATPKQQENLKVHVSGNKTMAG